ncbi:MAG: 3-hydroxyacyl-ACP dehydratase, partial [Candidatus Bathyarchaeia archaeon]
MKAAGLDVGSRTLKLVILNGNRIIWAAKSLSSFDQLGSVLNLLNGLEYDRITVTGYGRHLVSAHLGC